MKGSHANMLILPLTCFFSVCFRDEKRSGFFPPWGPQGPSGPHESPEPSDVKDDKGQLENRTTAETMATSQR